MRSAIAAIRFEDDSPIASACENEPEVTIGEISGEFGITFRTLRFYEQRGLISPKRRSGVRVYGAADRARLGAILKGKKLGFTLQEIRQMLAARQAERRPSSFCLSREKCVEQIRLLERQKRAIEAALAELRRCYSEPYVSAFALCSMREAERRN